MYLYKVDEDKFGFKDKDIHDILPGDVEISQEIYDQLINNQSQGKQYRLKNINGLTLEEIFEDIPHEPPVYVASEAEKQLADLTLALMINGVI